MTTLRYYWHRFTSWRYWHQFTQPGRTVFEQMEFARTNLTDGERNG
jgi:hypothetical protein